ncbi:MAG: hypothetical protein IJ570_08640 [Prevotella sp.]|nr:hypothetical protein [Prevotella sp.]
MVELPLAFTDYTRQLMGDERFGRFLAAFDEEPPVSIRLNPRKTFPNYSPPSKGGAGGGSVPWCPLGYYLPQRPSFTFDPLLHAGCYYVQEAASMFIHHILNQQAILPPFSAVHLPLKVLDLCAAPGGKSTCAISALPEGTELWSNEPVRQRASILSENIQKWGYANCHVTNSYPRDYVRSGLTFDIILCDVPCSGEGMFRKDPETIQEWSLQQVDRCAALQREIVSDAWQCLRPGGLLIYSTCTFNTKENEENVRWMLDTFDAELLSVPAQPEWGITGSLLAGFSGPVYRFIPGITRSEGLFVAVLRKISGPTAKTKKPQPPKAIFDSTQSKEQPVGYADVDYATAIAYLRGEALTLPSDTPRGLVAITFQGHALGLVKNIGSRANNLYPKEWRIRSTYVPAVYDPVFPAF